MKHDDDEKCCCHNEEVHKEHDKECSCHHDKEHEAHKEHDKECSCHHEHKKKKSHHSCSCCHDDDDDDNEEETSPVKIIVSAILFAAAITTEHLFPSLKAVSLALYAASYLLCGKDIVIEAVENLFKGKCFSEEFLMALATIGAVAVGEYSEAVAVMILFQTGEFLEDKASDKTRNSIARLVDIRSESAVVIKDSKEIKVHPGEVSVGDIIIVKPGERIPLDGIIYEGEFLADTSALTGESVPRKLTAGDEVLSGFINTNSVIKIQVTKEFSKSAVSRILEMVEEAQEKKASAQKFISRFAKIYTPLVCLAAIFTAIIPPLIMGGGTETFKIWIYRACEMLVVSCPCALVISVPLTFFAGLGLASKNGILIKGSNYMELLAKAEIAVFDKTGTLTKGVFEVTEIHPSKELGLTQEELLALITHAEFHSSHPISQSLKKAHNCPECINISPEQAEEISGHGIRCVMEEKTVLCGNKKLMKRENITGIEEYTGTGTIVYCAVDGHFAGWVAISDILKKETPEAIKTLKKNGITQTVMLSGDSLKNAENIAKEAGIDKTVAELLPQDKVTQLEHIMEENKGKTVIYTGDGINDAPVLAASHVGIAMGGIGSEAALEAADAVIMDDNLLKISLAVKTAKKTMKKLRQNIIFSLGIKILILILCGAGLTNMWMAVFGDVGVTLLAILNSTSLLWVKMKENSARN